MTVKPVVADRCGVFSSGAASALYWFNAVESLRNLRIYDLPAVDWILFAVSAVTAGCLMMISVAGGENDEKESEKQSVVKSGKM